MSTNVQNTNNVSITNGNNNTPFPGTAIPNCGVEPVSCNTGNITASSTITFGGTGGLPNVNFNSNCPGLGNVQNFCNANNNSFNSTYSACVQGSLTTPGNQGVPPGGFGLFTNNCSPFTSICLAYCDASLGVPCQDLFTTANAPPNLPNPSWNTNSNVNTLPVGATNALKQWGFNCGYSLGALVDIENNTIIPGLGNLLADTNPQNQQSIAQLYAYYCSLPTTENCPINSLTGTIMPFCSNMVATANANMTANGYPLCSSYFNIGNQRNTCYNASITNYCNAQCLGNTATGASACPGDCQCLFAPDNPEFQQLTGATSFNTGIASVPLCFWPPCQNSISDLVYRCFSEGPFAPANNSTCPPEVCKVIIANSTPSTVNISQNCTANGPSPVNQNSNQIFLFGTSVEVSRTIGYIIYGIVILLIFFIIAVVIFLIVKEVEKSKKK